MTSSDSSNSSMGVSKDPTKPNDLQSKPYMPAWRPTHDEVLNNTTPPPYTLNEFVKYLSKNHCLETLEFILEARRYRASYKSLVEAAGESTVTTNSSSSVNLRMLYQLLLTTYILPGAAREVNLSVNVAIASRKGTGSKTSEGFLSLPADFANPDSVHALFNAVKSTFNATPSVVVYNAASLTPPPDNDSVLSIPAESVTADLNINTVNPYVAAQQAVQAWEGLP
ncbi:hypothetical protein N7522_004008 [Penicillium canescens]|nr:hypothetical protein N7522_004008 [Penicillium canescens]